MWYDRESPINNEKRGHEMNNIYRLAEFNARYWEQQRKPSNIKSDILYDILAELHSQGKQINLSKVPAHIVIKGNEKADKAAN